MSSNAVGSERVAKVVGYELLKGDFSTVSPNLPQRVAIFGQANTDKQSGLTNAPVEVTSESQAAALFGYGSQIHIAMRVLRGRNSDIVGGIPTVVYPQLEPTSSPSAQIDTLTITGTATGNATHLVEINGRSNFDGDSLEITISTGDTPTAVALAISNQINNALSCPVSASPVAGVITLTTKWKGEGAAEQDITLNPINDDLAGLTYVVAEVTPAAGDSSAEILSSLELFGDQWNTIVINPYPSTRYAIFENFNGVAGAVPALGRYGGEVWKPFICLSGNKDAVSVSSVTAGLDKDQATMAICPAPNSKGWNVEAAANVGALLARQAQDNPHLDVSGMSYIDMPVPSDSLVGIFAKYNDRDALVKAGSSTVILSNGKYKIEDFVTTYHPVGESVPAYRYTRSLIQDFNLRYAYFLLEQAYVVDHAIMTDEQTVSVGTVIKPKQWKAVVGGMLEDLARRAIIVDVAFAKEGLAVATSQVNPDRLETSFPYKRSPFARIASTTAEAGFAFGI